MKVKLKVGPNLPSRSYYNISPMRAGIFVCFVNCYIPIAENSVQHIVSAPKKRMFEGTNLF